MEKGFLRGWNNAFLVSKNAFPYAAVMALGAVACGPASKSETVQAPIIASTVKQSVAPKLLSLEQQELLNALKQQEVIILDQLARILKHPPAHKGKQITGIKEADMFVNIDYAAQIITCTDTKTLTCGVSFNKEYQGEFPDNLITSSALQVSQQCLQVLKGI